jgi:hypothetical protein
MAFPAVKPLYIYTDIDGNPLDDGYLYFGTANADPQASPITVYWDSAATQVATQPIRTIGGYPINAGVRSIIYSPTDYSINVRNKNGTLVYTSASENNDSPFVWDGSPTSDVLKEAKPLANYTVLRAYTGSATGFRLTNSGIAGIFQYDSSDTTSGCVFTGEMSGTTTLTATAITNGSLSVGQAVNHPDTGANIGYITALGTGVGGIGTYTMSATATFTSKTLHADNGGTYILDGSGRRIKRLVVNGDIETPWFGLSASAADNYYSIMGAVRYAYSLGGRKVTFQTGVFKTSPISFQGFTGIWLEGAGGSVPSISRTTLQIISAGIGLQFADTSNPTPSWYCSYSKVKGIYVNCNSVGTIGINGAFGFDLEDVNVRNATSHGVQLESYTYPCYIHQLKSSFNGGHGIYIRGPVTTKWSMSESEFSGNELYGMCIEGAANSSVRDVTCQANVTGGVKVYFPSVGAYLSSLMFDTFYTEGNGLIGSGNPGYEGDYAVVIDSYDTSSSVPNCAADITFKNCRLNKSTSGNALNINRVYGFTFEGTDLENYTIGTTVVLGQYAYAGVYNGRHFNITGDSSASTTDHLLNIKRNVSFPKGNLVNGLWLAQRGRTVVYTYTLASIAAATTVLMDTDISLRFASLAKGYKMYGAGSVLGMCIHQGNLGGAPAGTLTIRPLNAAASAGFATAPANALSGAPSLTLTCNSEVNKKVEFTVGASSFAEMSVMGIEITSSAGYVAPTRPEIVVELFIEV